MPSIIYNFINNYCLLLIIDVMDQITIATLGSGSRRIFSFSEVEDLNCDFDEFFALSVVWSDSVLAVERGCLSCD